MTMTMTLLEVIKKAAASTNPETKLQSLPSDYPIILSPLEALNRLKRQSEQDPDPNSLIEPVSGFEIATADSVIIRSWNKFHRNLRSQLKKGSFGSGEFLGLFNKFLEKLLARVGVVVKFDPSADGYTCKLIERVGFFKGLSVSGLVLEACLKLEIWDVLEALIVHKTVEHSCFSKLVNGLVEKNKSDLLCACIRQFSDLGSSDLLCILKHFLSPSKDAYASMVEVRKEWESQALLAIENATDKSLKTKQKRVAKEASVLLMVAYDGFTVSELCLHYLLASANLDEFILTSAVSKLNGLEMMSLVRYLGKWLKKYERFPQAVPCPKASSMLGLKACDWVPTIEAIVKCLGLVLDEHFSSLVLHPEFHEELRSIHELANSFTMEARLCCSIANVVKNLRREEVEG